MELLNSAPRARLLARVQAAHAAAAVMHTRRRRHLAATSPAAGVTVQTLYTAEAGRPLRPGEPARVRLIELAPGACFTAGDDTAAGHAGARTGHEWLVLAGRVLHGQQPLHRHDWRLLPPGAPMPALRSDEGALVFLREAGWPAGAEPTESIVIDAQAGWTDFAPKVLRRVLWQHAGQAAMLYRAEPGAAVPQHGHGHDEECLMLDGELFLDDLLLQRFDWQLAPAGSRHRSTDTDTGALIYAHGDLALQFEPS
jgi:hypothetical protein